MFPLTILLHLLLQMLVGLWLTNFLTDDDDDDDDESHPHFVISMTI
jgi:hypothetical protein